MKIGVTAALVAALGSVAAAESTTLGPDALGPRTVRYHYEARVIPPAGARVVEMWMPLPREEDQAILALRLEGSGHPTVVRLASAGDRVAYLRLEAPKGPVTITQTATVARREVAAAMPAARTAALADIDVRVYASELGPSPVVQINDEVRAIAARETRGKDTVVARARALYDWVFGHMQYDKSVPGYGLGDIPYCLKIGKGNCTDFHTLFIALARASGIPARWNMGFPLAYGSGAPGGQEVPVGGYHCWAEFYAPGAGWVPVDISEARKHPELKDYFFGNLSGNRILFTRGRDLVLEPRGDGKPLNYLIYPVARADGKDIGPVEWTFRYADAPVVAAR
jgi:transglutaminase-like putative cysteine protease